MCTGMLVGRLNFWFLGLCVRLHFFTLFTLNFSIFIFVINECDEFSRMIPKVGNFCCVLLYVVVSDGWLMLWPSTRCSFIGSVLARLLLACQLMFDRQMN
uniref:Uncharacterized protein n=1 Tax=Rhizophora mucronata TaxID=61149 RepID=A0A2P2PP91_RHIMU